MFPIQICTQWAKLYKLGWLIVSINVTTNVCIPGGSASPNVFNKLRIIIPAQLVDSWGPSQEFRRYDRKLTFAYYSTLRTWVCMRPHDWGGPWAFGCTSTNQLALRRIYLAMPVYFLNPPL